MKVIHHSLLLPVLFGFLFSATQGTAQQQIVLDDFNKSPQRSYVGYAPSPVILQEGYSIYYESAKIELSRVIVSDTDVTNKALLLRFGLPPHFSWGNWLSVRREFEKAVDLSAYDGLEMLVKVELPSSNVLLRVTLSDVTDEMTRADEMWWADLDSHIAQNTANRWLKIRIPFEEFYLSRGGGTRQNDRRLNLSRIVAFEINIVSEPHANATGAIALDSLHAYK